MRVWLLDGGTLVIDHSQLMWNINPGVEVRFPVFSVLIEHDDELMLLDTGYDREHTERVLPFEPSEVTTLVNSHVHFDHCGGNRHLPGARVLLHERELAQARSHEPFERLGYSDATWDHPDARIDTFSGDVEVARGLWLYETPGHSAGHVSLLVRPDREVPPMLFPVDVALSRAAFEREVQASFHIDPVAGQRSIRRVKELAAEHGAEMYYAHDAEAWQGWKHAPDYYEV
jgi:4-pyridoxolactonase